jgi:hypothetical protein
MRKIHHIPSKISCSFPSLSTDAWLKTGKEQHLKDFLRKRLHELEAGPGGLCREWHTELFNHISLNRFAEKWAGDPRYGKDP